MNAIVDALAELGVRHIEMPATPERVWRAAGMGRARDRKFADSPLEESGFEPVVPATWQTLSRAS